MTRWLWIAALLAGCPFYSRRPDPPEAPERPVPIEGINSPFDDFNSADMSVYRQHRFAFSSNRGSRGKHFDIYDTQLRWRSDRMVSESEPVVFMPTRMSEADERGPLAFNTFDWNSDWAEHVTLAWSSNRDGGAGGFDFYAIDCRASWQAHRTLPCVGTIDGTPELLRLAGLSSARDDLYLSKAFADRRVLFASNRDAPGDTTTMDIYAARWGDTAEFLDAPRSIARVPELSSAYDDTAPYVWRPMERDGTAEVVFVSDRRGGLGEHDIYCSRYDEKADRWSAAKNLGTTINSAKDEYRPIVFELNTTRFLVFSSTREGGQGGYDLYITAYPGCPRS